MIFIKTDTQEYPLFLADLKLRFPNVSFKKSITSADLASRGYAVVQETEKPSCTKYQKVVEAAPVEVDGIWTQQWAVVDLEGAELVDNLPSWSQVETAITNISSLADAKVYLGKLSRVVYLMAKNKVD